jgi:hypothetical protein
MDVIRVLCLSLGSSTVQLHDSLDGRRACACSKTGFSSENATAFKECTTEEQRSPVRFLFLWEKERNAKDIHTEMFHVYVGKCLSCKAVHNWVEIFSQGRSKVANDTRPGRRVQMGQKQLCSAWKS